MASLRGYLTQTELASYANITITDPTEADEQISIAEEIIDSYLGHQEKFVHCKLNGKASVGGSDKLTLQADQISDVYDDYYKGCRIEILGGTGAGTSKTITSSTEAGVITATGLGTTDTSTFYVIYQLGKIPRNCDAYSYTDAHPYTWYKKIPEAIKNAVASQVEYMIAMGDSFFASDSANKESERIGDYSYTNSVGSSGIQKMIAPKAKLYLKGITNRKGVIILE